MSFITTTDVFRDLKAVAQTSTSLVVSWKAAPSEHTVTGYYVGYRIDSPPGAGPAGEAFAYKTVEATMASLNREGVEETRSEEHCVLNGLKKHTRYEVIVQAFNSKGAGPPSDHVQVQTLEFGM